MELDKTFPFDDWKIKYTLLKSEQPSSVWKTIVFVHGTPWSSVVFVPVVKKLLAQHGAQVLLYDLPGYGKSQEYTGSTAKSSHNGGITFAGDTSVKFQGLALSKLLEHLKLDGREEREAPAVVAHDIAGTIVLRSLLLEGCRFRSLLLMDTNTVLPWGDGFYNQARNEPKTYCEMAPSDYEATLRQVIHSASCQRERLVDGWEEQLAAPWLAYGSNDATKRKEAQHNFVRQIAQANDADVAEMLDRNLYEQVSCPVKILWGEEDQWIPKHKMEQLAKMLKRSFKEFVVIPEAGHLIMIDQPERVESEVVSWLSNH